MAFLAKHFSFNGTPCEEFGLALYDIEGNTQGGTGMIASTGEIVEDWIPTKSRSLFYGVKQNTPLTFTMVFGVNPEIAKNGAFPTMDDYLDRWEIAKIANWLTGHTDNRKWLEIEQSDMESVRYFCTISDLKIIQYAWMPWAFSCTVMCDSPYGYLYPKTFRYSCTSTKEISLYSKSTVNESYYPKMTILPRDTSKISIVNHSDNGREFLFTDLPTSAGTEIVIDNERGIITAADGRNVYDSFNFNFFRLYPGNNKLTLAGDFDLVVTCEFPVNTGG